MKILFTVLFSLFISLTYGQNFKRLKFGEKPPAEVVFSEEQSDTIKVWYAMPDTFVSGFMVQKFIEVIYDFDGSNMGQRFITSQEFLNDDRKKLTGFWGWMVESNRTISASGINWGNGDLILTPN